MAGSDFGDLDYNLAALQLNRPHQVVQVIFVEEEHLTGELLIELDLVLHLLVNLVVQNDVKQPGGGGERAHA